MNSIKKTILIIVISVVSVTFASRYGILLKEFESEAHEKETQINRYIELSKTFIELMTIYGNEFFQQNKDVNSELYNLLEYDPLKDSFNLDAAVGTKYQKSAGNVTGKGRLPEKGINRDELNLALKYNEFFHNFYERLEGVEWLYYVSENDFINLYPWVPSKQFEYFDGMKDNEFYEFVSPENNPQRNALWGPVYLDHAGKGMVVSLSSPIYNGGNFMGAISLDISTDKLREIMSSEYDSYLIDVRNAVIASDSSTKQGEEPINLMTVLKENQRNSKDAMAEEKDRVHMAGRYYIHSFGFHKVPWRMYFMVPVATIVYKAALATLPVIVIVILLIFLVYEFEKSKRTGLLLENSLVELKSYHTLLENAAKLDILTNTFNRRGLKECFKKRIDQGGAVKVPISFIIGDIDHFKQFNDTFGHAAGDKVLIGIADTIRKSIRNDDIICRWGGEEFVIALFDRTYEESMEVAEIIRAEVEALDIPWENAAVLKGTMTMGAAEYNYIDSLEECVAKADIALYHGKENGRNQVNGYRDGMTLMK